MTFKMKGHSIPGIKGFKGDKLKDGRHGSSPFQQEGTDREKARKAALEGMPKKESPKEGVSPVKTRGIYTDYIDEMGNKTKKQISREEKKRIEGLSEEELAAEGLTGGFDLTGRDAEKSIRKDNLRHKEDAPYAWRTEEELEEMFKLGNKNLADRLGLKKWKDRPKYGISRGKEARQIDDNIQSKIDQKLPLTETEKEQQRLLIAGLE